MQSIWETPWEMVSCFLWKKAELFKKTSKETTVQWNGCNTR